MPFMTHNFLLTSDNAAQEEWARLYTSPAFQLSKEKIYFPLLHYIKEENKWAYRHNEGYDILARYCDSRCPYYFDTPSLKEILL